VTNSPVRAYRGLIVFGEVATPGNISRASPRGDQSFNLDSRAFALKQHVEITSRFTRPEVEGLEAFASAGGPYPPREGIEGFRRHSKRCGLSQKICPVLCFVTTSSKLGIAASHLKVEV